MRFCLHQVQTKLGEGDNSMTLFSEIIVLPKLMFYLLIISGFTFVLAVILAHFSGVFKQIYTANYHQSTDNKYKEKDQSKFKCIFNFIFARRHVVDSTVKLAIKTVHRTPPLK